MNSKTKAKQLIINQLIKILLAEPKIEYTHEGDIIYGKINEKQFYNWANYVCQCLNIVYDNTSLFSAESTRLDINKIIIQAQITFDNNKYIDIEFINKIRMKLLELIQEINNL